MRIGLVQDGALTPGVSPERRMDEMIEEAVLAEEMGFNFYGLAEVHFSEVLTMSSPEVLLGAIAARTERIRLRTVSTPLLAFNHPIRVAERIATLDLVSHGRMELGTARSNQAHTIEAFGIPVEETRKQYTDSIEIIVKALSQESFEHDGPVWKIPERSLFPKPVQSPHPPVFASATSSQTHKFAGEQGLGIMSGNSLPGGWDFVQECLDLYRSSWTDAAERGRLTNSTFSSLALRAHCAETSERALEEAGDAAFEMVDLVMSWFSKLAKQSDDYSYMARIEEMEEHRRDLPFMVERAPYLSIGDPDFFVERIERMEEMGIDEFILEIDGLGHDRHVNAIELIGREVIPRIDSDSAGASRESDDTVREKEAVE
jgi:alkanesulfonate monooxygenase SsuD/methylene tetrahydromethanopterin reductase-like flavin-dependent oxidoreductase (luciferase family)